MKIIRESGYRPEHRHASIDRYIFILCVWVWFVCVAVPCVHAELAKARRKGQIPGTGIVNHHVGAGT